MASQDGNDKRMINITLNIELKKSESGKGYQELVKNVTKDAIDAALGSTNTINITELTGTPNKETEKLTRSLDSNNKKRKNDNSNSTVTVTKSVYLESKMETSKKERKVTGTMTDKGVETEAMKRVRLSLELKQMKKNKYDNTDRPKKTKASKVDARITNEYKDKPTIETEAMKIIRLRLERKNKSKPSNKNCATASITNPISSIGICQNIEGPANTNSPRKGTKRKVGDVGTDKTHEYTKGMKKMKKNNSRPNENYRNTRTSEMTNEQMDIDDENGSDHRNKLATAATCTGFMRNTTNEIKSATEKVGVETEAMRIIRRHLELMKNKNNNKNTATSTTRITGATSNTDTPTGAIKDTEQLRSPKPIKHKTAIVDKPTEKMKRMNVLPEHTKKSPTSKTSNAFTSNATLKKSDINFRHEHKGVAKYNLTPNEITDDEFKDNSAVNEITDDESDEKVNSEIANDTKNVENEHENASRLSSRSSYRSAMSFDETDDNIELATERVTRSKNWERRQWK